VHYCAPLRPNRGVLPRPTVPSVLSVLLARILSRFSCCASLPPPAMHFQGSLCFILCAPLHNPHGLIPSLPLSWRPLPVLACPPPAPSPAAASPSARWAPGTGRSPPSWCRRASGPGAGRGRGRRRDRAGWRPQEPSRWCRVGRPGQVGRTGEWKGGQRARGLRAG
jgi:hypothetical protein